MGVEVGFRVEVVPLVGADVVEPAAAWIWGGVVSVPYYGSATAS